MPIVKIEELIKPLTPQVEKNEGNWKEMILREIRDYNIVVKKINETTRRNNTKKIDHKEI